MPLLLIALLVLVSPAAHAGTPSNAPVVIDLKGRIASFSNSSGRVFTGVKLLRADARGLIYLWTNAPGGGSVALKELPAPERARLGIPESLVASVDAAQAARAQASARAAEQARLVREMADLPEADLRRLVWLLANPEAPLAVRTAVQKGQVAIGMTPEHVEASWGKPTRVYRSITSGRTYESWNYGEDDVRFLGGAVTSIDTFRRARD